MSPQRVEGLAFRLRLYSLSMRVRSRRNPRSVAMYMRPLRLSVPIDPDSAGFYAIGCDVGHLAHHTSKLGEVQ